LVSCMVFGGLIWVEKIPFFVGIQTRGVSPRWLARCVKHPPHRPWGYLQIERFHGARLVSSSSEPKAVNACTNVPRLAFPHSRLTFSLLPLNNSLISPS
jgi:hypothetical protein